MQHSFILYKNLKMHLFIYNNMTIRCKDTFVPTDIINRLTDIHDYADGSFIIFDASIKRIFKHCFLRKVFDIDYFKNNTNKIITYLESLESLTIRKMLCWATINMLKISNGDSIVLSQFEKLFDEYSKQHKMHYYCKSSNNNKFVSLEMIYNKWNTIYQNSKTYLDTRNLFIFGLYTFIPSLRCQDYYTLHFYTLPENTNLNEHFNNYKVNFLDTTSMTIVIGNYKTTKNYNLRYIKLPSILHPIVSKWRTMNKTDYVFVTRNAKQLSSSAFRSAFNMMFKGMMTTDLNVDNLRHIYVSETLHYLNNISIETELKTQYRYMLAHTMGHSIQTQEFVYNVYKDNEQSNIQFSSSEHMKLVSGWFNETIHDTTKMLYKI